MDILTAAAEGYWNWLRDLNEVSRMFILRWGWILFSLAAAGTLVRSMAPPWGALSLAMQLAALTLGLWVGFAIPVHKLASQAGGVLLTMALVCWLVLPYFVPLLLARRYGVQQIACRVLYAAEFILFWLQLIAL